MKVYLLTVVVFIIAKVGFMWTNSGGHPFTMGDVCDVIRLESCGEQFANVNDLKER